MKHEWPYAISDASAIPGTIKQPNADEVWIAMNDGGQKALDLVDQTLTMVSDFLNSLFDGE